MTAHGATMIELRDVGMRFRLHYEKAHTLKETLLHILQRKREYRDFWALRHISAEIRRGESVAIIGRNGSGKSTLLKILAGVFEPTEGRCTSNGTVSALIELGAGFNAELTGRENVFLSGAIMGFSNAEMLKRYDRIVDFAGIAEFMDTAVKNYSSGMYARLGFALATDVDAEILLIDEILAVGDEAFQRQCMARIEQTLSSGKTVVFVSHDPAAVARICSRAILLRGGEIVHTGPTQETLDVYHQLIDTPTLGPALGG